MEPGEYYIIPEDTIYAGEKNYFTSLNDGILRVIDTLIPSTHIPFKVINKYRYISDRGFTYRPSYIAISQTEISKLIPIPKKAYLLINLLYPQEDSDGVSDEARG